MKFMIACKESATIIMAATIEKALKRMTFVAQNTVKIYWLGALLYLLAGCAADNKTLNDQENQPGAPVATPLPNLASTVDDASCPVIQILEGTGILVAYASEQESADNIDHQATITQSGRNCLFDKGHLSLRVGTSGRVAKGPKSTSDSVTLPIRIVVLRGENEVLFSQLYTQLVPLESTVPQDFSLKEDAINLTVDKVDGLRILVGFDTGVTG